MNWRWFAASFAACMVMSGAARAADTLAYGAAPAWIKPLTLEPEATVSTGGGSTVVLLQDREVRYGADYDEIYTDLAYKALTPAGLSAAGTITRSWNPATTSITINRLEIIRGGQVIDALAPNSPAGSDPFLVLRRETNLSIATLDGTLTATKQLNGLRVGDIVRIATTSRYHDALLGGVTQDFASYDGPVAHVQIRLTWPKDKPVRWRATEGFGDPRITQTPEGTELLLDRRDVKPMIPAEGAPARYFDLGLVQVSELANWQAVSRLFSPLYDKASTLQADSPLKAEAARIRTENPTKAGQAAAALKLVQDQVRYVALAMGDGGLNPAAADLTWNRRFGDCKGKTALLLALLRELGIEARPALVLTEGADGLDQFLPTADVFDHVMVRAVVDGKTYWLDGTRLGDGDLAGLPVPDMEWALPLTTAGAALERLVVPFPSAPQEERLLLLDLSDGKADKAPARVEVKMRGEDALETRLAMEEADPATIEATLKTYLKGEFGFEMTKASLVDKDGVVTISGEGSTETPWYTDGVSRRQALVLGGAEFGYFSVPDRSTGFNPDAPVLLDYPNYQTFRIVVTLPGDGAGFDPRGADSDLTAGGVRITRATKREGRTLTIDMTSRTPDREASLADLKSAVTRFKAAPTSDNVVLLAPRDFAVTTGQLNRAVASDPTNAEALVELGVKASDQRRYADALRQYDAAIAARPDMARAWRARSFAKLQLGDSAGALADAQKAVSLDPTDYLAPYALGVVHTALRQYDAAVDDFTAALKIAPDNTDALIQRAGALVQLKRLAPARADIEAGLKIDPDNEILRGMAVGLYMVEKYPDAPYDPAKLVEAVKAGYAGVTSYEGLYQRGRTLLLADSDDGLTDLAAAIRLDPERPEAYGVRGAWYLSHNKAAEGAKDLDRLVTLSPTAASYMQRGAARLLAKDYAGARADYNAAAAKDPESPAPGLQLAVIAQRQNDTAGALAQLDKVIAAHPDLPAAYRQQALIHAAARDWAKAASSYERALAITPTDADLATATSTAYERAGQFAQALAALDKAVALQPNSPQLLNNRCYLKAKGNVQAESAVADCDAALKLRPDSAATLDSRGLAHLRMGQWDEAIADYDAALKIQPILADSSYGRAIARARKGDAAGSRADIATAKRASPEIDKTFAEFGLTP